MSETLLNEYKIEKRLAKNKFSLTHLCTSISSGKKVVVKSLYSSPPKETIDILNQINYLNLKQLPHSEYIYSQGNHFIVRDYFEGSDLKSVLNKTIQYAQISKAFFIDAFIELFKILNILHSNGILHADIKPSNILILHKPGIKVKNWDPKNIMIIDFERAVNFPLFGDVPHKGFSLIYSPPEQILRASELYSPSIDIFAATMCLLEALTHKKPLYDCNAEILINLQLTYPIPKSSNISGELFNILQKALYKEKFPRPPHQLTQNEIKSILEKGINSRYKNANEIIEPLKEWIKQSPASNVHWIIRLFKRIFIE